jgi:hypothetical protein
MNDGAMERKKKSCGRIIYVPKSEVLGGKSSQSVSYKAN